MQQLVIVPSPPHCPMRGAQFKKGLPAPLPPKSHSMSIPPPMPVWGKGKFGAPEFEPPPPRFGRFGRLEPGFGAISCVVGVLVGVSVGWMVGSGDGATVGGLQLSCPADRHRLMPFSSRKGMGSHLLSPPGPPCWLQFSPQHQAQRSPTRSFRPSAYDKHLSSVK